MRISGIFAIKKLTAKNAWPTAVTMQQAQHCNTSATLLSPTRIVPIAKSVQTLLSLPAWRAALERPRHSEQTIQLLKICPAVSLTECTDDYTTVYMANDSHADDTQALQILLMCTVHLRQYTKTLHQDSPQM